MRKISFFLAASAALLVAACGHQPSASQQTVQVAEPSQQQIQLAAATPAPPVQLAAATVDGDNRPFAPDELGAVTDAAEDAANTGPRPLPPGYVYAADLRDPYAHDGERCQSVRERARQEGETPAEVIRGTLPDWRHRIAQCF